MKTDAEIPDNNRKNPRDGPHLRGSVPAGDANARSRNLEDRTRVSRYAAMG